MDFGIAIYYPMNRTITYITGGERSGKSSFGQKLALERSENPIYLATAKVMDNDFSERVKRHQSGRDDRWQTIEKAIDISELQLPERTVMMDCITLWLYNIFYDNNRQVDSSLEVVKEQWTAFINQPFNLLVISNELGMGVHAATQEARKFVELHGWVNQFIASTADNAYLMVSGIPVKIK